MKASTLNQDDWVDDFDDLLGQHMTNPAGRCSSPAAPQSSITPQTSSHAPEERPPLSQEAIVSARAKGIQDLAPAGYLAITLNQLLTGADAEICQKYIGDFLKDAGEPNDPVERLMLESTALAHHCAGNWTVRAANSKNTADAVAFGNLAVKMYGEFRRMSLAVKEYRAPVVNKLGSTAEHEPAVNRARAAA